MAKIELLRSRFPHTDMLLIGALFMSSCAPLTDSDHSDASSAAGHGRNPEVAATEQNTLPPPFHAGGFEPPWSMEWKEDVLTISVGIDDKTSTFTDLTSQTLPNGWRLLDNGDLEVLVLHNGCLDLAGESHEFDIDARMSGERLVGCGDETK